MLELPGVTLCCIDTVNHALALRALRRCAVGIRFGATRFITDRARRRTERSRRTSSHRSPRATRTRSSCSNRCVDHIETPHVLLVQWDGYAINPGAWRSEFLDVDYIGAKWYWQTDGPRVGNGGFSLRSRKLLEALRDPRIVLAEAEDVTIGRRRQAAARGRTRHPLRIGSARRRLRVRSRLPIRAAFGFHGLYNFCRVEPQTRSSTSCAISRPRSLARRNSRSSDAIAWRCGHGRRRP